MRMEPYQPCRGDGPGAPAGYACLPCPSDTLPPMTCGDYLRVPGWSEGTIANNPWEDLSAVEGDPRIGAIPGLCGVEFDPFDGLEVDLYTAFLDNGLGDIIEDDCYPGGDAGYETGALGPVSFSMGHGC